MYGSVAFFTVVARSVIKEEPSGPSSSHMVVFKTSVVEGKGKKKKKKIENRKGEG